MMIKIALVAAAFVQGQETPTDGKFFIYNFRPSQRFFAGLGGLQSVIQVT